MTATQYELDPQTILLPIDEIKVGVNIKNIRTQFDNERIVELAKSIYKDGLLNPLVVTIGRDGQGNPICELVCGARRLRAIQYILAALDENWGDGEVKCTKFTGALEDAVLLNGLENIEREDVDAVDLCDWLYRMVEEAGHTQDELAERMHKSAQWISARITVHKKGSDKLKAALREGLIPFSVAYELAKQLSTEEQDKRIEQARKGREKLTLAEAEVSGDPDRVPKPSKKKLGAALAKAERAAANPAKRNAHGVAMGLRYVLGLVSEDELEAAIQWEGEAQVEEPREEPKKDEEAPAAEPEKKPRAARAKGAPAEKAAEPKATKKGRSKEK